MRIVENTPDQLVIRTRQFWIFVLIAILSLPFWQDRLPESWQGFLPEDGNLILYAPFFIGAGLYMLNRTPAQRVQFDRTAQVVRISERRYLRQYKYEYPLARILRAEMQELPERGSDQPAYQVELILRDGVRVSRHPLPADSNRLRAEDVTRAVNAWLDSARRAA